MAHDIMIFLRGNSIQNLKPYQGLAFLSCVSSILTIILTIDCITRQSRW